MADRKPKKRLRYLDWAFEQLTGSRSANHLLIVMARRGNKSGLCWMRQSRLASEMGCGLSTVQRAMTHLKKHGYIVDVSRHFPERITRTFRLCMERKSKGQNDRSGQVVSNEKSVQIDTQNPKEPKLESRSALRSPLDNYLNDPIGDPPLECKRRKRSMSIGELAANIVNQ